MTRQILCRAVQDEIGGMMAASRASIVRKQQANQAAMAELNAISGKSRDVVAKIWARITQEKNAYNAALAEYKVNSVAFNAKKALLLGMLNKQRLEQALAESARSIADSWTTVTLQRSMSQLVRGMSEDFEAVFAASEGLKGLMQGVYDTFTEKFRFEKLQLPSLDLDPHRTKLKLLVHETAAFVKDPMNVLGREKSFMVRSFYNTLVKQARAIYGDARQQAERWMAAVTLPLEVQIRDHKAQLQSRLDNLAKINEKTTTVNEQMAELRASETALARQREMIEALIQRITLRDVAAIPETFLATASAAPAGKTLPPEMVETLKLARSQAPAAASEAPLVPDDVMAELGNVHRRDDPASTQPLAPVSDRTMRIAPLSPDFRPDAPKAEGSASGSERTAESIRRLQEAKRILQRAAQK